MYILLHETMCMCVCAHMQVETECTYVADAYLPRRRQRSALFPY
jgi:hypothetical protein